MYGVLNMLLIYHICLKVTQIQNLRVQMLKFSWGSIPPDPISDG